MDPIFLPSSLIPDRKCTLTNITLEFGEKVEVHKDKSMHVGKTIKISNFANKEIFNDWLYFHALLTNSFEIIDYNENPKDYELTPFKRDDSRMLAENLSYEDVGTRVYRTKLNKKIKYAEFYKNYLEQSEQFRSCVRSYFLAQSISSDSSRIKSIDISYWQVNMYVSILEVLIGSPPDCENGLSCSACGADLGTHHKVGTTRWIKQEFLDKVKGDNARRQYRDVINICRNAIRHKSIHEGLMPSVKDPKLKEGLNEYEVKRAVKEYKDDKYAQFALVDAMRQIVRFKLLSQISGEDIFPSIWSHRVYSLVLKMEALKKA